MEPLKKRKERKQAKRVADLKRFCAGGIKDKAWFGKEVKEVSWVYIEGMEEGTDDGIGGESISRGVLGRCEKRISGGWDVGIQAIQWRVGIEGMVDEMFKICHLLSRESDGWMSCCIFGIFVWCVRGLGERKREVFVRAAQFAAWFFWKSEGFQWG
jgi:hypothetical protein